LEERHVEERNREERNGKEESQQERGNLRKRVEEIKGKGRKQVVRKG
jgi:hypothetical protein